tara:strand:- start:66 stop:554 length:489 start_codon:yes stop_codon:yes gene_type:complete
MSQLHLEEWVKFHQTTFPTKEVPPYPTKKSDITFSCQLALENWNEGKLNQNLFGNKVVGAGLPADVQLRLQQNALLPTDGDALRKADLTFYANQCDLAAQRTDDVALEREARLSAERAAQVAQAQKEWSALPLGHPSKQPSPEQAAYARKQWGITGLAEWQK